MVTPDSTRCHQCHGLIIGRRNRRRTHHFCCQPCWAAWRRAQPRRAAPHSIRRLSDEEPLPCGKPRRYTTVDGYKILRWKIGLKTYVEALEHRVITGRSSPHVHHKNGRRDDNAKGNLVPLTPLEHGAEHSTVDFNEAVELYSSGWSLPQLAQRYGVHNTSVMRGLKRRGVAMRTIAQAWAIRRYGD